METTDRKDKRSRLGYGSSYRKGAQPDGAGETEIRAVLGGQAWLVRPDMPAEAANPCLWMQAGVVKFKNCSNFYDCTSCNYDRGMQKGVEKGKHPAWQDVMRKRPNLQRFCRHSVTQRIPRRVCAYDYRCTGCDFDQFFEDVWSPRTQTPPADVHRVKGFEVPMGYCYHNGHTWARIESGGGVRIGMDDFALKLLGKPDALDLPLMGKELDPGRIGWGLRKKENRADVLSPVGGVITEVNPRARENPGLANQDPYGDGWLFMVHTPDVKRAVKGLMTDSAGLGFISNEVGALEIMIEAVAGPLAADGGFLAGDIYGNLPALDWKNLVRTFLKT